MSIFDPARISKRAPQRLVRQWIKALRSGKYHQAQHQLREKGYEREDFTYVDKWAYCCLGVACNLIDRRGWKDTGHKLGDSLDAETVADQNSILGPEALKLLGLKKSANDKLSGMNDQGDSFETIANFLERQLNKVVRIG